MIETWPVDNLARGLCLGLGATFVYLGAQYAIDPSLMSSHGDGARLGGAALVVASLAVIWAVCFRSCVGLSERELWVVNLPRTYVIPLAQIRNVQPTTYGLSIRYWTGSGFDTVEAIAIQRPRGPLRPGRSPRAERIAEAIRTAVAQAQAGQ